MLVRQALVCVAFWPLQGMGGPMTPKSCLEHSLMSKPLPEIAHCAVEMLSANWNSSLSHSSRSSRSSARNSRRLSALHALAARPLPLPPAPPGEKSETGSEDDEGQKSYSAKAKAAAEGVGHLGLYQAIESRITRSANKLLAGIDLVCTYMDAVNLIRLENYQKPLSFEQVWTKEPPVEGFLRSFLDGQLLRFEGDDSTATALYIQSSGFLLLAGLNKFVTLATTYWSDPGEGWVLDDFEGPADIGWFVSTGVEAMIRDCDNIQKWYQKCFNSIAYKEPWHYYRHTLRKDLNRYMTKASYWQPKKICVIQTNMALRLVYAEWVEHHLKNFLRPINPADIWAPWIMMILAVGLADSVTPLASIPGHGVFLFVMLMVNMAAWLCFAIVVIFVQKVCSYCMNSSGCGTNEDEKFCEDSCQNCENDYCRYYVTSCRFPDGSCDADGCCCTCCGCCGPGGPCENYS